MYAVYLPTEVIELHEVFTKLLFTSVSIKFLNYIFNN